MYVCTTAKHAGKKREMEVLASFRSEASGVHFYDFRPEDIVVGLRFCCEWELLNAKDPSSILLRCGLSGTLEKRPLIWHHCLMQDQLLMGKLYSF